MTTYTVTTSNWNDPSFWSSISETAAGHTLDLSAFSGTYTVDFNSNTGNLTLSDGTTTFKVGDVSGSNGPYDATLGGSTNSSFFDTLLTSDGDDHVTVTSADDEIHTGAGNDTVDGSTGHDTINTGAGQDSVDAGGGDDLVHGGAGNDTLRGATGADTIDGGDGDDTIEGGGGADFLTGGAGNDSLTGNAGVDTFGFYAGGGADTISGFNVSSEVVDVGFSGVSSFADLQPLISNDGGDALITFADGSTLRLNGVNHNALTDSDFTFSPGCFCAGTQILTDRGEVPVESIGPGDKLVSADGGYRTVLWLGQSMHRFDKTSDRYKPIEIKPGALGRGRPVEALRVSHWHRIVLSGDVVEGIAGVREVFVPAKSLLGLPGVRVMRGLRTVRYFSVLCDRHAVIFANGAPAETFYPGAMGLANIGPAGRQHVRALYPDIESDPEKVYGPMARKVLRCSEAVELVRQLRKENRRFALCDQAA